MWLIYTFITAINRRIYHLQQHANEVIGLSEISQRERETNRNRGVRREIRSGRGGLDGQGGGNDEGRGAKEKGTDGKGGRKEQRIEKE